MSKVVKFKFDSKAINIFEKDVVKKFIADDKGIFETENKDTIALLRKKGYEEVKVNGKPIES